MSRISIDKKVMKELDKKKKVNPPNMVLKRNKNLLAITMVRYIIYQTNVGVM